MTEYILASGSPRRKEILTQVGISFKVMVSDAEEVFSHSEPEQIVEELARLKCMDVAGKIIASETDYLPKNDSVIYVIGADTMVSVDGLPLGKPKDKADAFNMIKMIEGREHIVSTGVSIAKITGNEKTGLYIEAVKSFCENSSVIVNNMSDEEINEYISTNEPYDKAGSYAIQGIFAKYIKGIRGDYYNIVGFPICRFLNEIKDIA